MAKMDRVTVDVVFDTDQLEKLVEAAVMKVTYGPPVTRAGVNRLRGMVTWRIEEYSEGRGHWQLLQMFMTGYGDNAAAVQRLKQVQNAFPEGILRLMPEV